MAVRTAYVPVAGAVLTAVNLAKLPGGWIGDTQATANQTGITTATDLTSLSLAVTVGTGRRIRLSASFNVTQATSAGLVTALIMEGATQIGAAQVSVAASGVANITFFVTAAPTAGAHTYKVQLATSAGSVGTSTGATTPASFLVEDIGATP